MVDVGLDVPSTPLVNVGSGPSPVSIASLAHNHGLVVVYLQRDHHCTNCRSQVQSVGAQVGDFRERGAEPVSVVPEPTERVRTWQEAYDLPYPLLADPDATVGESLGQPIRFGWLGDWSDFLGRMPLVAIIDGSGDAPNVVWTEAGRSTFDRPSVDDVLDRLDAVRVDAT